MDFSDLSQLVRNTARFREVVSVLAKYGLADWLQGVQADWVRALLQQTRTEELGRLSREARVRGALTELGTTFIKLGQVLSTRPDLVGPRLADELAELRTGTPPDSLETIKTRITEELEGSVEELFAEFSEQALASASIGQVHKATLHDGTSVVVKVQHDGIEERVHNDLEIIERLAELAEKYAPRLRQFRPRDTAADFRRTLLKELDFGIELRNLERFRRNFKDNPGVRFPLPFAELSTARVLTMEMFEGVNLSHTKELQDADVDLEAVARRGASLFVDMIFRDAFCHADPHPGNLMILASRGVPESEASKTPAAVIGVLDCGMVVRLDESLRSDVESALVSITNGDTRRIVEIIVRRGSPPADVDVEELKLDIDEFLDEYAEQSIDQFDLSGCLTGIVNIIRRYQIVLPAKIAMLLKVLIMLEGTSKQLSPKFSLAELIEPYARKTILERYSPKKLLERIRSRYADWDHLIETLPADAADILRRMKAGQFDVHLEHRRLETTVNRLVLGILAAALFMGSASILSRDVPPIAWGVSLPGAIGCCLAVWLGYSLIRAIKRMGDIQQR